MSKVLKLSIIAYIPDAPGGEWVAIDQNSYDSAPDGNNKRGHGDTAFEAVADLIDQLEMSQLITDFAEHLERLT